MYGVDGALSVSPGQRTFDGGQRRIVGGATNGIQASHSPQRTAMGPATKYRVTDANGSRKNLSFTKKNGGNLSQYLAMFG